MISYREDDWEHGKKTCARGIPDTIQAGRIVKHSSSTLGWDLTEQNHGQDGVRTLSNSPGG